MGYILVCFLVIFLAVKWRSRKLEQEKQRLEGVIIERTREIYKKNQQLKEMDKVKSRFFANISHEFRTPLTLIMGPLEQILSTHSTGELKRTARIMLRNSQRLLSLVDQLLELAKLDSGKMKLQACQQNIVPILRAIIASFDSLVLQKKLDVTFKTQEENITFYFDSDKLEKIMGNLIYNAIKFTPPSGKIAIAVKITPAGEKENSGSGDGYFPSGSVDISVTDTGIGIMDHQLDNIFERFYQGNVSYEYKQKGSGIGLALTKELITLHHGEIFAASSTGGEGKKCGTEFIIRLPLGTMHLKSEDIVEAPEKKNTLELLSDHFSSFRDNSIEEEEEMIGEVISESVQDEKNIILVVEDNADMRHYIRGALQPHYQVIEAAAGKQGIEKAKNIIPDLIISDIMMPGVDGYELCSILKKDINTSHIPLILLTAKTTERSIIQGLETGADDYITKPFNPNILIARIRNLIELRRQLQLKRKRQMTLQPQEIHVSSVDERFYKDLQSIVEKNVSDPEFNVEQLHKKLYMGRTSLYRKILALTGETPTQFLRSFRLQRAAQLLKSNFGNVTEVAFAVGFSNTTYFSKCFKEKFHQTPSQYHIF
jgi:signal transduction histidine kinase/DNA-binding response OmpR family regulator